MMALAKGNTLASELAEARTLMRGLSSGELGCLGNAVLPGALAGEAGHWSLILLALISQELRVREHGGD